MIVMKFGGSSVESPVAIERVAGIVAGRRDSLPVVVVSAMGKTTNRLLALAREAVAGRRTEALKLLAELREYHISQAGPHPFIGEHFEELGGIVEGLAVAGEITPRLIDTISSFGERLSSRIVTEFLRTAGLDCVHGDARDYIVTDSRHTQAAPLYRQTYERLRTLPRGRIVVMGGFIAADEQGVTTTLGRGGSDLSASILGAGLNAEEIQIWTDVDGMLTCDPTILPGGHRVKEISFSEAAELAYFGAKVLHPSTVLPAIEKNIPVRILNSRRPEVAGTRISGHSIPCRNIVKSIACKQSITIVNIQSTRMLMAHGFLRRIFEVFSKFETAVDVVATSEVSVSLTIDDASRLNEIRGEIEEFAQVATDDGQAIVCLVGDGIRHTPGIAARIFRALNGVNVRMISMGASLLNMTVVVGQSDLGEAVAMLHAEFFSDLDEKVFG